MKFIYKLILLKRFKEQLLFWNTQLLLAWERRHAQCANMMGTAGF